MTDELRGTRDAKAFSSIVQANEVSAHPSSIDIRENRMKPGSDKTFFPYYFFEIALISLFTVEAVLILAVLFPSGVGREIDFSAQYSPRPEWYFLALYQLTKYFPGRWTFVGAVALPGLAFSVLLLAPFLDGGKETVLGKRKVAAAVGFGMLAAVILLTIAALL